MNLTSARSIRLYTSIRYLVEAEFGVDMAKLTLDWVRRRHGRRLGSCLTPLTRFGARGEVFSVRSRMFLRPPGVGIGLPQLPAGSRSQGPSANGGPTPLRARA